MMWKTLEILIIGLSFAQAQKNRGEPVFFEDLPSYPFNQIGGQDVESEAIPPQVKYGFAIRPTSTLAFDNANRVASNQNQNISPQDVPVVSPSRVSVGFGFSSQNSFQDDQSFISTSPEAEIQQLEPSLPNLEPSSNNQNSVPVPRQQFSVSDEIQFGDPPTFQQVAPFSQFEFSRSAGESSSVNSFLGLGTDSNFISDPTTTTVIPSNIQFGLENDFPNNQPIQSQINRGQQISPSSLGTPNDPVIFDTPPSNNIDQSFGSNQFDNANSNQVIDDLVQNQGIDQFSQTPILPFTLTPIAAPLSQDVLSDVGISSPIVNNQPVAQTPPPPGFNNVPDGTGQQPVQPQDNNIQTGLTGQQQIQPQNQNIQPDSIGQQPLPAQPAQPFNQNIQFDGPGLQLVQPLNQNIQPDGTEQQPVQPQDNNIQTGLTGQQQIQPQDQNIQPDSIEQQPLPAQPAQPFNQNIQFDGPGLQPVQPLNQNIQPDGIGQQPVNDQIVGNMPSAAPIINQQQQPQINLNQLPIPDVTTTAAPPQAQAPQPDISNDDCLERVCDQTITGRDLTYERALEILQQEDYLTEADLDVVRRHRRFKRKSENEDKPKILSRKTRTVCGFFGSCFASVSTLTTTETTTTPDPTCPPGSTCTNGRRRRKRQVCDLVSSMPVTSADQCLVLGVAGGFVSAAAIAIKKKLIKKKLATTPAPPPPQVIFIQQPQPQVPTVNAIDVTPEIGRAPRGVPQPGEFGGGAPPFARDNSSAEALGLTPNGFIPVAVFPPFIRSRTRADAVGVIFSESDERSITVAGFDPDDQVDFLNRQRPRFKRSIVQSLRQSFMAGLGRLRHQVRRFWGVRHARNDGYYKQQTTLNNNSNVRLNFIEVERRYGVRIRVRTRRRCSSEEDCNSSCREGISPVQCNNTLNGLPFAYSYVHNPNARQTGEEFSSDAPPDCRVELSDSCLRIRRRRF